MYVVQHTLSTYTKVWTGLKHCRIEVVHQKSLLRLFSVIVSMYTSVFLLCRGYREKGLYKALQKNKEMICKTLNPAPLTECEASFSQLVAMVTASMEREEKHEDTRSSDEETLESEEVVDREGDVASLSCDVLGNSSKSQRPTERTGHVTSWSNEVVALGEVGVYDPEFLHLALEAAIQVLEYLEAMQERLLIARLTVEVSELLSGR